jgi:hypothetical protein
VTTAEMVLEYVRTLTWPAVVVTATVMFRRPIAKKIGGLKTLDAAGVKTTFESAAEALESKADDAAAQLEAQIQARETPAGPAKVPARAGKAARATTDSQSPTAEAVRVELARRAVENLDASRNLDTARRLAPVDPNAAVMAAYRQFEQGTRAASGVMGFQSDRTQGPLLLIEQLGLDDELVQVVRELRRLRNAVTHSAEDVTVAGALAYIAAIERVMEAVVGTVLSRLRHPSRAKQTAEMLGSETDG